MSRAWWNMGGVAAVIAVGALVMGAAAPAAAQDLGCRIAEAPGR